MDQVPRRCLLTAAISGSSQSSPKIFKVHFKLTNVQTKVGNLHSFIFHCQKRIQLCERQETWYCLLLGPPARYWIPCRATHFKTYSQKQMFFIIQLEDTLFFYSSQISAVLNKTSVCGGFSLPWKWLTLQSQKYSYCMSISKDFELYDVLPEMWLLFVSIANLAVIL